MKVYVITKGDYSDYRICAVSLDPDKAQQLARIHSGDYYTAEVEEYDTDVGENVVQGRIPFSVCFYAKRGPIVFDNRDAGTFEPEIVETDAGPDSPRPQMTICLYAPDRETALKIACDKRARYLAEKAGI